MESLNKIGLSKNRGTWKSFRAAFKSVWQKDKIDDLAGRLERYRNELTFHILAKINNRSLDQSQSLDRMHGEIVEVISVNQNNIQHLISDNNVNAQRQHEETIAAILALRDDTLTTISSPAAGPVTTIDGSDASETWSTMSYRQGGGPGDTALSINRDEFSNISKKILELLYFRQFHDRIDSVADPHKDTYQWIYRDPTASQKPWYNFAEWLEQGTGLYWINGKAGSGKSTLMKFILENDRTRELLSVWAGGRKLITASFFCWNAGTQLQKSEIGLLRSLLFDILDVNPQLIPTVFPELYRVAVNRPIQRLFDLTLVELRKAFRRLIGQKSNTIKICLFVDGVDEYQGDPSELCALLSEMSESSLVKVVTSSRPVPACVSAFASVPSLRLQDLTYNDIKQYVQDRLNRHARMQVLEIEEGVAVKDFVNVVADNASGVFLWVILVVRSLLRGLGNYDRMSDLKRRLDELPNELEGLYYQMLDSMEPFYRRQASELFQIAVASLSVQGNDPLTVRQMSFASDENQSSISMPKRPISRHEEDTRCRKTEARIRSRCCGLVEFEDKKIHTSKYSSRSRAIVTFLHKSVFDFLRIDAVWQGLLTMSLGTPFDANVALLNACVAEVKISRAPVQIIPGEDDFWAYMRHGLEYARRAEQLTGRAQSLLVDELDQVMTENWKDAGEYYVESLDQWCPVDPSVHWAVAEFASWSDEQALKYMLSAAWSRLKARLQSQPNQISFLTLAQAYNLDRYVAEKLGRQMSQTQL